jgi:hypothetical protein
MSPTYYAVQTARLNRECEAARKAGDTPGMQRALLSLTNLMRHMYGTPEQRA